MKTETLGEVLYWSYANLGMAHAALSRKDATYGPLHYSIRKRLYNGLLSGDMGIRPLAEDERLKMILPQSCCYCSSAEKLAADHLIPRKRGGLDCGDNLVWSCRECNSSKGSQDVLVWLAAQNRFPPLLLLRRYLKLAIGYSAEKRLLHLRTEVVGELPFKVGALPRKYPPPDRLVLWITDV